MYDLRTMKSILCGEIAKKYGLQLEERHGRLWGKLRESEKTASFSINLKNNLWYDFGAGIGGSVIDLLAELEGVSITEAINILAEEYGFKNENTIGWKPLTNNQYRELGIQPERATMNFGFDLNTHTIDQLERWSNKYSMHVKDLAEKYPVVYNKMIMKIGMEEINTLKNIYDTNLNIYHRPSTNKETKAFLKSVSQENSKEINRRVELLQRATTNITNYMYLQVNFEKDFNSLNQNKIQEPNVLSEDEKVRNRIVKIYKRLFNCKEADNFTINQAKALQDINISISNADNKFIPIEGIRQIYVMLGNKLDKLEKDNDQLLVKGETLLKELNSPNYQKWELNVNAIKAEILQVKDLFSKCSTVIEGIREINLKQKNEQIKLQNNSENSFRRNVEPHI